MHIMQKHGLNTVLEDQVVTPPTFSYMATKHFQFDVGFIYRQSPVKNQPIMQLSVL